jgi:hypothetical protein
MMRNAISIKTPMGNGAAFAPGAEKSKHTHEKTTPNKVLLPIGYANNALQKTKDFQRIILLETKEGCTTNSKNQQIPEVLSGQLAIRNSLDALQVNALLVHGL